MNTETSTSLSTAQKTLSISVIIPTYNREEALRDTLVDVLKQDYPEYEIIVVDQTANHEPQTQAYLEELATEGKIQWYQINWASLPGARNYAVRRAKGDILLFIDDDVELPDGFLAAHARNYTEAGDSTPKNIGAVAGRVLDRMKLGDSGGALKIEDLPPEAMDPGIAWYHIDVVHTVKPQQVISARGCNMSFRRELFDQYGLHFDERYKGSAVREESDFCLSIRKTGYTIWYDPQAELVHLGEVVGGCHNIGTRSIQYQITFYHNHFFMGLKNLTPLQCFRFFAKLFDCHVLGHPPCNKSGSPLKIVTRFCFYSLGLLKAIGTWIQSLWNKGQVFTQQDELQRSALGNRQ